MKRDWLKGITFKIGENDVTLPDEVIEKIISENGKDIEGTKTKLNGQIENLQSEIKTKDELITNTNSEMEKFKTMDIEGIKNKVLELEGKNKEYETQLATSKETYEKQIQEQQYDFAVKEYLGTQKFTSDFTKNAFMEDFKKQQFKLGEDGKFLGADDYIKQFSEKNTGVFAIEEAPKDNAPSFEFTAPTGGQAPQKKMSLSEAMKIANQGGKVDFNQLG